MWAVIIGGHALLITIFSGSSKRHIPVVAVELPSPGVLVLIDLPPPPSGQPESTSPQVASASAPMISRSVPPPEIPADSTAITLPSEEQQAPADDSIDWKLETERSARYIVDSAAKPGPRHFGEQPVSPFREKKKPPPDFKWNPEPKKAGLAGGFIPYVRIGKRCVVGLGFWGCALGKLPEANSHLFDEMTNPERLRSSVPDVDTTGLFDKLE